MKKKLIDLRFEFTNPQVKIVRSCHRNCINSCCDVSNSRRVVSIKKMCQMGRPEAGTREMEVMEGTRRLLLILASLGREGRCGWGVHRTGEGWGGPGLGCFKIHP